MKVDPSLLWLLNISGYYCQLILACFADKYAFARLLNIILYYNNYYYNYITVDISGIFIEVPS